MNDQSPASSTPEGPRVVSEATISPFFKLIFRTVLGLTVLSLAVDVALIMLINNPSEQAKGLIETCSTTWKMGFGAIVGLIGGKADQLISSVR